MSTGAEEALVFSMVRKRRGEGPRADNLLSVLRSNKNLRSLAESNNLMMWKEPDRAELRPPIGSRKQSGYD